MPQTRKAHVWISDNRRPILINITGARRDDGKAVVGGRDTRGLNRSLADVVDERAFAAAVVAQQKDERQQGRLIAAFFQGAAESVIDGLEGREEGSGGRKGVVSFGRGEVSVLVIYI